MQHVFLRIITNVPKSFAFVKSKTLTMHHSIYHHLKIMRPITRQSSTFIIIASHVKRALLTRDSNTDMDLCFVL